MRKSLLCGLAAILICSTLAAPIELSSVSGDDIVGSLGDSKSFKLAVTRGIEQGIKGALAKGLKDLKHFQNVDFQNASEVEERFKTIPCDSGVCEACFGFPSEWMHLCENHCETNCKAYPKQEESGSSRDKRNLMQLCIEMDILGIGKLLTPIISLLGGLLGGGGASASGGGGLLGGLLGGGLLNGILGGSNGGLLGGLLGGGSSYSGGSGGGLLSGLLGGGGGPLSVVTNLAGGLLGGATGLLGGGGSNIGGTGGGGLLSGVTGLLGGGGGSNTGGSSGGGLLSGVTGILGGGGGTGSSGTGGTGVVGGLLGGGGAGGGVNLLSGLLGKK